MLSDTLKQGQQNLAETTTMLARLFNKGVEGAISRDLIEKYLTIKAIHPEENEGQTLARVWNLWLDVYEKHILLEENSDKKVRLDIVREKLDGPSEVDALLKQLKAYSTSYLKTFFTLRPRYSLRMRTFGTMP